MRRSAFRRRSRTVLGAVVVLASGLGGGCATGRMADESTIMHASDFELDSREPDSERIEELETRIAELERDLRRVEPTTPTSVRITSEEGEDPRSTVEEAHEPEPQPSGPRAVLRLYESAPAVYDAVPVVSERLPVAAMPARPVVSGVDATATPPAAMPTAPVPSPTRLSPPGFPPLPSTTQGPASVAVTLAPETPVEDLTAYRQGLAPLTARRYDLAIASLSAFLRDHPGGEQSDDALFWRATAQYALRHYREALVDFDRVVRLAPQGERAADSLYHAGLCHRRLGDDVSAASAFARLRRDYPNSVAARLSLREDTT